MAWGRTSDIIWRQDIIWTDDDFITDAYKRHSASMSKV